MCRKPVTLEMSGGKSPRQRIWEKIRQRRTFSLRDLTGDMPCSIHVSTVRTYVQALTAGGYLAIDGGGGAFVLAKDAGIEAPRLNKKGEPVTMGNGNERMWGAMEALGSFNAHVLARMADVPLASVKNYCGFLQRAGFLTVERPGKGQGAGGIATVYRVLRSRITGPRAPMITRLKTVYDPNVGRVVWQQDPEELLDD